MRTLTDKLQVSKPLLVSGATGRNNEHVWRINLYRLATLFVANAFGQPIILQHLHFRLDHSAVIDWCGRCSGGGVVMVGVLLHQLGLPPEGLAIIAAVDRITTCSVPRLTWPVIRQWGHRCKTEGEIGKEESVDAEPAQANA